MNNPPKPPSNLAESRERLSILRGVNLRNNACAVLSREAFEVRKNYLVSGFQNGAFLKDPASRGQPPANPMSDPAGMEAMMGMMKGNMLMMIPQTLIMSWINAFFSGYVICMFSLSFPVYPFWFRTANEYSETPVPSYHSLQVHVAVWCYDS